MNHKGIQEQTFRPGNWNTLPKLAAIATVMLGLAVLAGWVLSVPLLKSVFPGAVEMKANTAVGLVLSACALFMLGNQPKPSQQRLAQALALAVVALGLATLGEYLFGWQLGIDELLFRDTDDVYNVIRGRMSPYSAVTFAMIGLALTVLPWRPLRPLVWLLSILIMAIGAISLLGYLWNAAELVTDQILPPVAVNSAVAFALLGVGIFRASLESEQRRLIWISVEIRILAGFISAFLLLVLVGGYAYRTSIEYENSAQWVEHTQAVRAALGQLYGTISDTESVQRSYLLTGKPSYKADFQRFVAELNDDVLKLARLVTDNPAQEKNLVELEMMIAHLTELLSQHLSIFEQHGFAAAKLAISRGDGIQSMQAIRSQTDRMDSTERELLSERKAKLRHDRELALAALLATLTLEVAILAALFLGIHREIIARSQAQRQLRTSEENLSVTLNSIGDGVMATDAEGRVTRLNRVAEQLTGWSQAEALGRPVGDVFHIINQQTRQSAPIPVASTLAQGVIHGLANDTLLIARDGSEHQIADSCAPIHNRDGDIIGAVLVFRDVTKEYAAQAALRDSAMRIKTVLDTVADGIITINERGIVETMNPAAERLFGYAAAEVAGQNISMLMPEPYHSQHDGYIERYCATGQTRVIGIRREVTGLRKDGSTFPMYLAVSSMELDGQRHFTGIVQDITVRKQAEELLSQAKEKAELANRAKDSFLATMSHEIRTPLTGMMGMLEVLSLTPLNRDQEETLQAAWDSGRSLLRIVSDILDWSRIEEGKLHLTPQATSIPQLLQEVINTYSRVASAKSLVLRQHVDARISPAHIVDGLRLSQVLNNFVSNALKFTHSGEVVLSAELLEQLESGERIRFCVKDTGIGIAKDAQQHLFRRYQQESVHTTRMYGGTGLGLAICQSLVDLMDGQIELVSEPGHGASFCIMLTLPVSGLPGEALQAQNLTLEQRRVEPLHDGSMNAPLVLAVDDHPTNRELLALQLKLLGLRAETAENGVEALWRWRDGRFALVITDCHMPEMDGYAFTQAVRKIEAEERLTRTPIIAWTANALAEEVEQCRSSGMDDLLVKPVNLAQLKKTLVRWLSIAESGSNQPAPSLHDTDSGQITVPIDYAVLGQIVPDRTGQIQVLQEYQSHIRTDYARLTEMLEQGDQVDVERTAHRMKGSSRMVGAKNMAKACAAIEQAARDGNTDGARAARKVLDETIEQLERYLIEMERLGRDN